jgi:hypothetical protein
MGSSLENLAKALHDVERWQAQLIIDELCGLLPVLQAGEALAEQALNAAESAIAEPKAAITELDSQIAQAQAERAKWAADLDSPQIKVRVPARGWVSELDLELAELQRKRDSAESGLQPLYDARNKCRSHYELAAKAVTAMAEAMLTPFAGMGQGTDAYVGYRQPHLNEVILTGNRDHPEWETAIAELQELCIVSGYRTTELPDDTEHYRQFWDKIKNDANTPEPVPTGQDIHNELMATAENARLAETGKRVANRIDDYRSPANPRPRNETVPDYMKIP